MSALGLVLIMNGSDHIAPDADAPAKFRRYAQARPDVELKLRPLTEYAAEAHARAQGAQLQLATGELRSGYRAYLLGDTLSTRMPLKQLQRRAEVMLENHLEPMLTMLDMAGAERISRGQAAAHVAAAAGQLCRTIRSAAAGVGCGARGDAGALRRTG